MNTASIPMKTIGPVSIRGETMTEEVMVPLATFETPLWPSTNRGAKVSRESGGWLATIVDDRMARSVTFQAPDATAALHIIQNLSQRQAELDAITQSTSRFARLIDWHHQIIGSLFILRFEFTTGDASGHNMVTKASDALMQWMLQQYPHLNHVSVSGNFCTDKKVSAVNGILGRGKNVVVEMLIPEKVCLATLKTSPEKIVDLNTKKNLLGSIAAGSLRSANAHFANILLAFYLATGQDAANIVEGSQGIVHTQMQGNDLYFSATLPNIIVGSIGNGKDLPFVKENLTLMRCDQPRELGENAKRLAVICAATTACCELSLLAALTNPGELMRTHIALER